ncbi:hypothetical protein D1872_90190 [compost metagenome]
MENNITMDTMATNVYVGEFRAVKIAGRWRACKRNPHPGTKLEWVFLDEIEYHTATEALQNYI